MKNFKIISAIAIIGLVYIYTLAPTITTGDAGELITSAYTLGISHPPGYPLYVLIGKIFSYLPIGNIAFRINLMSVFFAICSLIIFYNVYILYFPSSKLAEIATLAAGISYAFWSQSIISEVHTLHIFLVLFLIWILVKNMPLQFFSLMLGIGLCNHHTLLIFVPILIFKIIDKKEYKNFLIYFNLLLGLSFYLYMPIRSSQHPIMDWGETHELINFLKHIARFQFTQIQSQAYSLNNLMQQINFYLKILFQQISVLFLPFFIYGFYYLLCENKSIKKINYNMFYLLYIFLAFSIGFILVINFKIVPYILSEVSIFFIPSYLIFILISFIALDILIEKYSVYIRNIAFAILVVYCFYLFFLNIKTLNKRNDYFLYDYGLNLLKTVPPDSALFLQSNHQTFSVGYLTMVENKFKNTNIFDREENFFPKIFTQIKNSIGLNTHEKIEKYFISKNPQSLFFGYKPSVKEYYPYGLLYTLTTKTNNIRNAYNLRNGLIEANLDLWKLENIKIPDFMEILLSGKREYLWNQDLLTRDLITMIILNQTEHLVQLNKNQEAEFNLDKISLFSYDIPSEQFFIGEKFWELKKGSKAIIAFNRVIEFIREDYISHNNLGLIYSSRKDYNQAIYHFQKAIEINPLISEPYYNIAVIYQENSNFNVALEYLIKASRLDSARPEIFYNIGLIYNNLGSLAKAEENYLECIKIAPEYILAHNNLGLLYLRKKEINNAIIEFNTVLKYDSTNLMAYFNLANAYENLDKNQAVKSWETYILKANRFFNEEENWIKIANERINKLIKELSGK
ncbi:DUF2723 domain-containing protein [Candidatus Poribacteria bacterium]|nr:DUF2723 domain-containing protein [Candidatus Poribacteria bacterium]